MAQALEAGKEPTTNLKFSQDTILNSKAIKQYNHKVAELLGKIIYAAERSEKNVDLKMKKLGFCLSEEGKATFEYSKIPVSISELVYSLNGKAEAYMKKLRAVDITSWLLKQGYLEQREMENGNKYKVATELGNRLGIINETKVNSYGNRYSVNLYNEAAQKFIVDNLDKIGN